MIRLRGLIPKSWMTSCRGKRDGCRDGEIIVSGFYRVGAHVGGYVGIFRQPFLKGMMPKCFIRGRDLIRYIDHTDRNDKIEFKRELNDNRKKVGGKENG